MGEGAVWLSARLHRLRPIAHAVVRDRGSREQERCSNDDFE